MQEQPSFFSLGLDDLEAASDDEEEDESEGDDNPGEKGDKAGERGDKADNSSDDDEEGAVPVLSPPLFLGLRVYTQNKAVATVTGKLSV
ncbi:hypothetical protein HYPSUDRAFT_49708 [Hypholoma sublateritium FD-334 SS-4]|uniref:Uncharacterized protein n=1 Tax=Hypholoma sublateritium (strain FD-334 SS-4) TaxID=945553 RepID=A0A0D2NAS4_HYPSF|nr:hypothetical protein HYPSUDRAFT_49708 [Hypholoma sublateritium FD-334 SS-4]